LTQHKTVIFSQYPPPLFTQASTLEGCRNRELQGIGEIFGVFGGPDRAAAS
jgi:hypothetical protein